MDAIYTGTPEVTTPDVALTRVLHSSRLRVFEAFTRPDQLARWWGPDGFTLVGCDLDLREGGAIRMVMRGPDGKDYPFHGRYLEVLPPARISFTADLETGADGDVLVTTLNLEEVDGATWLTVRQTVPATEAYARGQRQGWSESLERLQELLAAD